MQYLLRQGGNRILQAGRYGAGVKNKTKKKQEHHRSGGMN